MYRRRAGFLGHNVRRTRGVRHIKGVVECAHIRDSRGLTMLTNCLSLGARALILLLILTSTASAGRMTFEYKSQGCNHEGCDWIAAEGDIVEDSADDFEKFLKGASFIGVEVRLHSPGGSLIGGVKLGEAFRKRKISTTVGRTVKAVGGHPDADDRVVGICVSACAIAFIASVERSAPKKTLGINQFYEEASLKNPSEKIFNALDMSGQQMISAILIDYAFRMGVDPRFIAMASSTPPDKMYYLNKEELDLLKVNWRPKDFEPWSIEPSGRGVIAFSKSKDKTRTAVVFCRADRVPRLFLRPDSTSLAQFGADMMKDLDGMDAFGIKVPRTSVALKKVDGAPGVEFPLPGFRA